MTDSTPTGSSSQNVPDLMSLLLETYGRHGVEVEQLPPTGMRIQIPGNDPVETDYADAIEQARDLPAEQYPELAEQVALTLIRQVREQGVPLGTHYPPRPDDHGRQVLVKVLHELGYSARFEDPQTISVPLRDGERGAMDMSDYLSRVEDADLDTAFEEVTPFAEAVIKRVSEVADLSEASSEQLRVRLYPESGFPEGVADTLLGRRVGADLVETVALDTPDTVQPVTREQHEETGRSEEGTYGEAVANSVAEPVEVSHHDFGGMNFVHIGGEHPYVSAQLHVLTRHLEQTPHGVLVALPVPQVVLAHVLGEESSHPVAALELLQNMADRFVEEAERPITSQVYWWHPSSRDRAESELPDLRAVRIEIDQEQGSASLFTDDDEFGELLQSLLAE
ncbi:hypothetical protein [Nocardiopsis xinjiangensis]|uniref:hypothetical protein n=1 Tax=Nocardiopsis xinjiangensis TaxID=124285 RepID=UPI000371A3C1|nr:hypothetical protein [Nocardiopsis xinjiangensis]